MRSSSNSEKSHCSNRQRHSICKKITLSMVTGIMQGSVYDSVASREYIGGSFEGLKFNF